MKSIIGGCFGVVLIWRIMKIYHIIKRFWLLQWYYSLEDQEDKECQEMDFGCCNGIKEWLFFRGSCMNIS